MLTPFGGEEIEPLAIDAGPMRSTRSRSSNGRQALYRIKLDQTRPTSDWSLRILASISTTSSAPAQGGQVIGYSFVDDKRQTVYFDSEHKALAASLNKALPGPAADPLHRRSQDGTQAR